VTIRKLPDGTIEADTGEELAAYELLMRGSSRMADPTAKGPGLAAAYTNRTWLFVCRSHFNEESEEKTVGVPGEYPCALCGKTLRQGTGTVTMRPEAFALAMFAGTVTRTADPMDVLVEEPRKLTLVKEPGT